MNKIRILLVRACPVLIWAFSWSGAVQAALAPDSASPKMDVSQKSGKDNTSATSLIFRVTEKGILEKVTGDLEGKLHDFFRTHNGYNKPVVKTFSIADLEAGRGPLPPSRNTSAEFSLSNEKWKLDLIRASGYVSIAEGHCRYAYKGLFFSTTCPVAQGYLEKHTGQSLAEQYPNLTRFPGFVAALADNKEGALFPDRSLSAPLSCPTCETEQGASRESHNTSVCAAVPQHMPAGDVWEAEMGQLLQARLEESSHPSAKLTALDARKHYQCSDTWYIRNLLPDTQWRGEEIAFCWPVPCSGAILLDMYQANTGILRRQYFVVSPPNISKQVTRYPWAYSASPRNRPGWLQYSPLFPPEEVEALFTEDEGCPPPARLAAGNPGEWMWLARFLHINQMILQAFFDAEDSEESEEKEESSPQRGRAAHERINLGLRLDEYFDEKVESATWGESAMINTHLAQAASRCNSASLSSQIVLFLPGAPREFMTKPAAAAFHATQGGGKQPLCKKASIFPRPWERCLDRQEAVEKLARLQLAFLYGWERYEGDLGKAQLKVVTSPEHVKSIRQAMASVQWWKAFLQMWQRPDGSLKDSEAVDFYEQLHKKLSYQETDLATNLNSLFNLLSQAYRLEKHEQSVQEEKSIQEEVDRLEKHEQRKLASSGKKRKKQSVQEEKSIQEEVDRLEKHEQSVQEEKSIQEEVDRLWQEGAELCEKTPLPQAVRLRKRLEEKKPPLCATKLRRLLEAAWKEGGRAWDRKRNEDSPIVLYGYLRCKLARQCAAKIGTQLAYNVSHLWQEPTTQPEAEGKIGHLKQLCACHKDLVCLQQYYGQILIEGDAFANGGGFSAPYKAKLGIHIEHLKKIHFSPAREDLTRVNSSLVQHLQALKENIDVHLTPVENLVIVPG